MILDNLTILGTIWGIGAIVVVLAVHCCNGNCIAKFLGGECTDSE